MGFIGWNHKFVLATHLSNNIVVIVVFVVVVVVIVVIVVDFLNTAFYIYV